MAYAVKYAPSGIGFHLLNVFLLAKIREFAEEAIVAAAGLGGGFSFFKKRTSVKLGYNEKTIICISLFCQSHRPFRGIDITYIIIKKLPKMGSLA